MKDIMQNLGNKSKLNKTVIVAYEVIQALVLGSIGHTLGGFLGSLFDDK
jgi:hypothetical protein